ncbi:hypothetical protein CPB97_007919 [Podila verticillata]|nr:hypothetical protein CPB97_007919 [Podila verticillata]
MSALHQDQNNTIEDPSIDYEVELKEHQIAYGARLFRLEWKGCASAEKYGWVTDEQCSPEAIQSYKDRLPSKDEYNKTHGKARDKTPQYDHKARYRRKKRKQREELAQGILNSGEAGTPTRAKQGQVSRMLSRKRDRKKAKAAKTAQGQTGTSATD